MKFFPAIIFILFIIVSANISYADVVITIDNMYLNGKIVEKKPGYVLFSNYYGTFTIKWKVIKKIYETQSFEEDVKVFKKLGRKFNATEIKRNYLTGLKKKKKKKEKIKRSTNVALYVIPHYYVTVGKFSSILPSSIGASFMADIYFSSPGAISFLPHLRIDGDYQYLDKGKDSIQGSSLHIGPLWSFGKKYILHFSPLVGAGYYKITSTNSSDETFNRDKLSLNGKCIIGFNFKFYNFVIGPQFRMSYIHDSKAPLYGLGGGLALGYIF